MDKGLEKAALMVAIGSGMMFLTYPGGGGLIAAIIGKKKIELAVWVFIVADITAFCISMAVLIVGMTVGPTFWEKIKKHVRITMHTAIVAMAIAMRHVALVRSDGDEFLLRLVNGLSCVYVSFLCFLIYMMRSDSRENHYVRLGPWVVVFGEQ